MQKIIEEKHEKVLEGHEKVLFHISEIDSFATAIFDSLTHFMALASFYTTLKLQKATGFLMFSAAIERDQCHEMG